MGKTNMWLVLVFSLFLMPLHPALGEDRPLSADDVMALLGSGMTPAEVGSLVKQRGYRGGTEAADLKRLKDAGADAALLLEVREAGSVGLGGGKDAAVAPGTAVPQEGDSLPWDQVGSFSEGLAGVVKSGRMGFVDKSGQVAIPLRWTGVGRFADGVATVAGDGGHGLIDKRGREILRPEMERVERCSGGLLRFQRKDSEKWGFVNRRGEEVIKAVFDAASDFSDGMAVVKQEERYFIIDGSGNVLGRIPERVSGDQLTSDEIYGISFEDGPIRVEKVLTKPPPWEVKSPEAAEDEKKEASEDDKNNPYAGIFKQAIPTYTVFGYVDQTGRLAIDFRWDLASDFHEGRACVARDLGKWGFIDRTGAYISEPQWLDACDFSEGLAAVRNQKGWGFIDLDGRVAIPPQWKAVQAYTFATKGFREGLAAVQVGDKWGFTDREGRMAVPAQWEIVLDFHEGLAAVQAEDEKWGFIDRGGRVVIKPEWDHASDFSEGFAGVAKGEKWGFIDKTGRLLKFAQPPSAGVSADSGQAGRAAEEPEGGDAKVQYELGCRHRDGNGVPQDALRAVACFRKAAEQGFAPAQNDLGNTYHNGRGVGKDDGEAVKWWRRAAEGGNAIAQINLGNAYYNGWGVGKDDSEAVNWWRRAAEGGLAAAQKNLGDAYYNGWGVEKDDSEAVNWWRRAAEGGLAAAQNDLGNAYGYGWGVGKDDGEAIKWYRKAAEQNQANAQFNLGVFYRDGRGVAQNREEANKWFRRAAEQGLAEAKKELMGTAAKSPGGAAYTRNDILEDLRTGLPRRRIEAKEGKVSSQQLLWVVYFDFPPEDRAIVGVTDRGEAIHWLIEAAKNGDRRSQRYIWKAYFSTKREDRPNCGISQEQAMRSLRDDAGENDGFSDEAKDFMKKLGL